MLQIGATDLLSVLPALCLLAGALAAVALDVALPTPRRKGVAEAASYAGVAGALLAVLGRLRWQDSALSGFSNAVVLDDLALFLSLGILVAAGLAVVVSSDALRGTGIPSGEYHALLLIAAAGMLVLVESVDLVTFFVALETLSICVYALAGVYRRDPRSNEAAVKYLVMGAFATGFLLYGIALVYGATGSLNLRDVGLALANRPAAGFSTASLGLVLMAVGLAFKVGAVPFHMWVPDVYEGAPTPVTAFMSVAVKAAAFGAFLRVLLVAGPTVSSGWGETVYLMAIATMVLGNLLAVSQRSVKRMLAYSSVAHTGYVLVALAALRKGGAARDEAGAAAVFYLFSYVFMTLGAFAFALHASRDGKEAETLEDYAGLAKRRPWSALAMTVFMVSLAGLPPTSGFFAKFAVFRAAVSAGDVLPVVVGVLASAVSVFYYLRVVVYLYMHPEPENAPALDETPNVAWVVFACAGFTVLLGLLPGNFLRLGTQALLAVGP